MARRLLLAGATLIAWFGLLLQLRLTLVAFQARGLTATSAWAAYLGYFTVLTNILVALVLGWLLVWTLTAADDPRDRAAMPTTLVRAAAAMATCIAIVGATYALLLRHVWNPQGPQWLANAVLHYVTPVLYLIVWWVIVPRGRLRWRDALPSMAYPFAYLLLMLGRGAATGFYPYHFLDVRLLGPGRVAINAAAFTAVFAGLALALIALDRAASRRHATATLPYVRERR